MKCVTIPAITVIMGLGEVVTENMYHVIVTLSQEIGGDSRGEPMHPNSEWLIKWCDRMVNKYGQPKTGYDWCSKLAHSIGEEGDDNPSDYAIEIAKKWETTINWREEENP